MALTQPQAHVLAHLDDVRGDMMLEHRDFVKWELDGEDVTSIINALQRKGLVMFPKVGHQHRLDWTNRRVVHHPDALLNMLKGYGRGRQREHKA